MAIQIQLMSWNIQKKTTNAPFIAKLMSKYQIDICALLEVPKKDEFTIPCQIKSQLDNLTPAYHKNNWRSKSVDVGNECVTYIWHEDPLAVNKFKASVYTNSHDVIAGKVVKNINNDKIYFPTTGISWAGLPGKPNGRRPSFMAFETNDGAAIRRFTFLDIHAPFNTDTSIQSYSAHLYASSREIYKVETLDVVSAASAVKSNAIVHMKSKVDSLVPTAVANRDKTRTAAVDAVIKTIQESHTEGNTLV